MKNIENRLRALYALIKRLEAQRKLLESIISQYATLSANVIKSWIKTMISYFTNAFGEIIGFKLYQKYKSGLQHVKPDKGIYSILGLTQLKAYIIEMLCFVHRFTQQFRKYCYLI